MTNNKDIVSGENVTTDLVELTSDIVSSYVAHNPVSTTELPGLISEVHRAMSNISKGASTKSVVQDGRKPAVPIKKSLNDDFIICLEDGKKFKSLKRHLSSHYGLTPQEYREKWGLPADYPMVAPNYAKQRSHLAKKIGLGRRPAASQEPKKAA